MNLQELTKSQRYYYRNLEKQRERGREKYRRTVGTPEGAAKNILRGARERSKKFNIKFDLDIEWIMEKLAFGKCEVSGIPFKYDGTEQRPPFAPSIDQIEPRGGYTKDNCQIVVWIYNVAKGSNSHDDVLMLARALTNGVN